MLPKQDWTSILTIPLKQKDKQCHVYYQSTYVYDIFDLKGYEFAVNGTLCLTKVYLLRDLSRATLHNITYRAVRCEVSYFGL